MPQIEIHFEVFKVLTNLRPTEDVTYNDVLRSLLKLPPPKPVSKAAAVAGKPWVVSDTTFPAGAEFLAEYKGNSHTGVVKDGKLVLSAGHTFSTPSAAAMHFAGCNVNGWRFWKCKLPGASQYVLIEHLRRKEH